MRLGNLRSRLTLGVVLLVAIVFVFGGAFVARDVDRAERQNLDDRLRRTAELSDTTALATLNRKRPDPDKQLDQVLDATRSSLLVSLGGAIIFRAGTHFDAERLDAPFGFSTRNIDGEDVRIFTKRLREDTIGGVYRLHATTSLRPVSDRRASMFRRLVAIGVGMLLAAGVGAWFAADLVLRPLRRLRAATASIEGDADLEHRVPEDGPEELRSLARSFNAMLERLGRSAEQRNRALAATRRFAADAGHELRTPLTSVHAALTTVYRHPDVDPATRSAIVEAALVEQRRLVELLDGLQALARGDSAPGELTSVDLSEVVDDVAGSIGARHPRVAFRTQLPNEPLTVCGWEPGLRILVGNLVENAARHGREDGTVTIALRRPPGAPGPQVVVADDGEGIAPEDRERVFEPFARGTVPDDRRGTGLGLALVRQQALHHGASVTVGEASGGGCRFVVQFGVGPLG